MASNICHYRHTVKHKLSEITIHVVGWNSHGVTSHNSTYVHRRLGRRLGLRGAAARRSATWPFALGGLRATSHTCDSLYAIALGGD
jgi:hypothetical protein